MPQEPTNAKPIPQGLTPLVHMFPMHMGEPTPPPARPGPQPPARTAERAPNPPGQAHGRTA